MAAVAEGTTVIKDAAELKVKETDRIETICDNLKAMGCNVTPTEDGMSIVGGKLKGAVIHTLLDHRIAMAFSIAALVAEGIPGSWTAGAWMCPILHFMIHSKNCCNFLFSGRADPLMNMAALRE